MRINARCRTSKLRKSTLKIVGLSAFPLLPEGRYFLPRLAVVPAELPAFPSDQDVQRGAVALQDSPFDLLDGDRFIPAVNQSASGQHGPVELAGLSSTSVSPVLLEAISMTRSGGLPCREMT